MAGKVCYPAAMPKRDFFQRAFDQMQQVTGYVAPKSEPKASAVKGGQARAANLTAAKRRAIARKAAQVRWADQK